MAFFTVNDFQVEIMQQLLAFDGNAAVEHVLPESARAPESIVELVSELQSGENC